MNQSTVSALAKDEDVKLNFIGDFDGHQAIKVIHDLIARSGSLGRVALGFSHATRVRPLEIHYLLAQLAMNPCFSTMEISIEGLQCQRLNKGI